MKLDTSVSAIVSGGSSGLGEATARLLASRGVRVAIFDFNVEIGEAVAKSINGVFCKVDVTSEEQVDAAFAQARAQFWMRAVAPLPDSPVLHQAALGYLSDYWFPITSLTPHLDIKINTGMFAASLNHTLWFHEPHQADEWVLIDAHSPRAIQGRGLTQGRVYNRSGRAVATFMQETLFRGWDKLPGYTAP